MHGWTERRDGFAAALAARTGPVPAGVRDRMGVQSTSRFDVYRNNVTVALIGALEVRFPVVRQLVGDAAFREVARRHAVAVKPASPLLFTYGDDFADTLAAVPELAGLDYLPDVARLEALYTISFHAADATAFGLGDLGRLDADGFERLRLAVHPALNVLASAHPVASLWAAHQGVGVPKAPEMWGPETVIVTRPEMSVEVRVIAPEAFALLAALRGGCALGEAAEAAAAPGFDPGAALVALVAAGCFAATNS